MALPLFVPPMLAVFGKPFDSEDYIFELKWDGFRTLVFRDESSYRLMSRSGINVTANYPEFGFLADLPPGTVLDGELVALDGDKSVFEKIARRAHGQGREAPLCYIAFDLLYRENVPVMEEPLMERKRLLEEILSQHANSRLVISEWIDANGRPFFAKAVEQGREGVIAKQKQGLYYPGKRMPSWKKIKRTSIITCVVIGFIPAEDQAKAPGSGFRSLLLASDIDGKLTYVGKAGTGFSATLKDSLYKTMLGIADAKPCVPCEENGIWVRPELFCQVGFTEFTSAGVLRAPVFKGMVKP